MSVEILHNLQRWGLPDLIWRNTRRLRNRQFNPPFQVDSPEQCLLGSDYWKNYSCQIYQYQFNSWGFRDCDFDQYRKEIYSGKVNICIGDSFTLNFGGSREHSWPHQLSKYYQQPTLNLGINLLTANYFNAVVDKCRELFNVDKVFILYNLFENSDLKTTTGIATNSVNINQRLKFLKQHCWVHGAYWQFVPPWTFLYDELPYLYEHFPGAHNYFNLYTIHNLDWSKLNYQTAISSEFLAMKYQELTGHSWPSYENFLMSLIIDSNSVRSFFKNSVDVQLINEYLSTHLSKVILSGRDGWHMSPEINRALADYFYILSTKDA
jgi:hypothetical protein